MRKLPLFLAFAEDPVFNSYQLLLTAQLEKEHTKINILLKTSQLDA